MGSDFSSEFFDREKERKPEFFIPMLPVLAALALSYGIASSAEFLRNFKEAFACLGAAFLTVSFWLRFSFPKWRFFGPAENYREYSAIVRYSQIVLPSLAVFFAGIWYWFLRSNENPLPNAAPTDANIRLRILDVSRGENGLYGLGIIEKISPEILKPCEGAKAWYSLRSNVELVASQLVEMSGFIYPSDFYFEFPLPKDPEKRANRLKEREKNRLFARHLSAIGADFKVSASEFKVIERETRLESFFSGARKYMQESLSAFPVDGFGETLAAKTYRGMILGDKGELTREQKEDFIETGTMHVFAISGMHVGFAAAALALVPLALGFGRLGSAAVVLPVLLVYVCACGARPSAMRAFLMIAFVWLAPIVFRKTGTYAALVLSAVIALVWNPSLLMDSGFVLSYGVVLAIIIYGVPLSFEILSRISYLAYVPKKIRTPFEKFSLVVLTFLVVSVCMGFSAAVAGAPLTAHFFAYATPLSAIYSPLFTLGAEIAVVCGFAGFALPDALSGFLNLIGSGAVWLMSESAKFGAGLSIPNELEIFSGWLAAGAYLAFIASAALLRKGRFLLPPIIGIGATALLAWIN